ncbi:MAG: hypothetical protein IJW59_05325 [Clostridia bacterium]|nr:hypothetical protein [Clostridia bacterium]
MKKIDNNRALSFDEYKKIIDNAIETKSLHKLRLDENYFDTCGNYWIVDKYISCCGQIDENATPNTLSAYQKAIDNNYVITIPVQMLDDESIVCFAHQNLSKIIPNTSGYIKTLQLSDLKQLNLNEKEEKIPTLEESLEFIANRTQVIIEILNDGMIEKFESKVLAIIQNYIAKYDCYNNIAIMSINPFTLEYFYKNYPYITRILKSGNFKEKLYGSIKTRKLKKLKYYKITQADFIAYSHELLPNSIVEKYKPVGIIAYTLNNQNQYIKLAGHCDNIIFKNFTPTI